jgi:hypothetical protein
MTDASRLIEVLQPPPSKKQLKYLKHMGASDALLKELTTMGEASALIADLQEEQDLQKEEEED